MGVRNYLIEGVSGSEKTAVAEELQRRGFDVVHGDRQLAYVGDAATGRRLDQWDEDAGGLWRHHHHVWDEARLKSLIAAHQHAVTFFCGGSRNYPRFIDLFDGVFVLQVDRETLRTRLSQRPEGEFGGQPAERSLIEHLHATGADIPDTGLAIDATVPLNQVADSILAQCDLSGR